MPSLAVVILTLDERDNLSRAIESVPEAPVIVLDSGSKDGTIEYARQLGAEVHVRPFTDYADQRNAALELTLGRFEWVFFLDADERVTPALWDEIVRTTAREDIDGAYVGLVFEVLGRRLEHGSFGSASVLRLMRPRNARFTRGINERVDDSALFTIRLDNKLVHADAKPLAEWFKKHVRYAQAEAMAYFDIERSPHLPRGNSEAARVAALRRIYDRMPLFVRPWLHWFRTVFVQAAWKDGCIGLAYASMHSLWYRSMIDVFIYEEKLRRRGVLPQRIPPSV